MRFVKIITALILFLLISFVLIKSFFPYYREASDSMEPNLSKGDLIFVNKYYYKFKELRKDDIVLIKSSKEVFSKGILCHRVIATSGDKVTIKDKKIYINDSEIKYSIVNSANNAQLVVPDEMFFQKGDNPTTHTYGIVDNDQVIGKVVFNFTKMKLF